MALHIDNDSLVQVKSLRAQSDGVFINDAILVGTLFDSGGVAVTGAIAISLAYLAGSNGNYEAVIPGTITLVQDASYRFEITSSNYIFQTELWEQAKIRTG